MELEMLQQILGKLTSMETDIKDLKQGQANLETEVKEIKAEVKEIKQSQINLETKVDRGLIQQKENTDFIKAIKHATEENNAKLEGITLTVARLEGRTSKIEADTSAIAKKLNTLETVTIDNWGEISRLKAVK